MFCPKGLLPTRVCTSSSVMSSSFYLMKAWGERYKRQVCRNTAAEKSLSWELHQTGTSERKEITRGICWTWCICGRLFLKSNSPAAEDSQIWLSHPPALSEHPSSTTASGCLLCSLPQFVLRASVHLSSAKDGLQAEQLMPITEPASPEGQQDCPTLCSLFFRTRGALTHCSACTTARQGHLPQAHGDLKFKDWHRLFPQLRKHSKVHVFSTKHRYAARPTQILHDRGNIDPKLGSNHGTFKKNSSRTTKSTRTQPVLKPRQHTMPEWESARQTMT